MGFVEDIVSDEVAPPFLQGPFGSALLKSIGQSLDTLAGRSEAAAKNGMPGLGDPSALPLLGLDRLLLQGPDEADDAFIARLSTSFDTWQRAGNDWTLLEQVLKQFLPLQPPAAVVSNTSFWSYYDVGANTAQPPLSYLPASGRANWNWDNNVEPIGTASTPWWRIWLLLFSFAPNAWAVASGGLGTGGPALGASYNSTSLGFQNVGPQFWVTLRQAIVSVFKAQHAWVRWIVVSFDNTHCQPNAAAGDAGLPDGSYGPLFGINAGSYVPNRNPACRYVPGVI